MNCPVCGLEMAVMEYNEKTKTMTYVCRNKQCKERPVQTVVVDN